MENRVKEIIIGSLLGDGWLSDFESRTATSRYRVKYNIKSLSYLLWLRDQMLQLNPCEPKHIEKYGQNYFYTQARKDIGELRTLFYPQGKKVIPKIIGRYLTPLSLAIWYQDDGTLDKRSKYHWNAMFATYCFSYEECSLLAKALAENFGIIASVCKCQMRGKMYYRLYIVSKSMQVFVDTIKPFIHPVFDYKISLK
jgi:hypothetical protein